MFHNTGPRTDLCGTPLSLLRYEGTPWYRSASRRVSKGNAIDQRGGTPSRLRHQGEHRWGDLSLGVREESLDTPQELRLKGLG
ncbi:jg22995 [Pararge aegeria aegeria]|uniref:Jg22995 protein n=1 Tax=Pararge aegeria aegeria TaxID=348720 RepID=A0A8S4QGV0_9NEOP|nr:jg22995 [Pararge aegeria aegeria]